MVLNFEKSKASDPHILLLNLLNKIHLGGNDKYIALSNRYIHYTREILKIDTKTKNVKCHLRD